MSANFEEFAARTYVAPEDVAEPVGVYPAEGDDVSEAAELSWPEIPGLSALGG